MMLVLFVLISAVFGLKKNAFCDGEFAQYDAQRAAIGDNFIWAMEGEAKAMNVNCKEAGSLEYTGDLGSHPSYSDYQDTGLSVIGGFLYEVIQEDDDSYSYNKYDSSLKKDSDGTIGKPDLDLEFREVVGEGAFLFVNEEKCEIWKDGKKAMTYTLDVYDNMRWYDVTENRAMVVNGDWVLEVRDAEDKKLFTKELPEGSYVIMFDSYVWMVDDEDLALVYTVYDLEGNKKVDKKSFVTWTEDESFSHFSFATSEDRKEGVLWATISRADGKFDSQIAQVTENGKIGPFQVVDKKEIWMRWSDVSSAGAVGLRYKYDDDTYGMWLGEMQPMYSIWLWIGIGAVVVVCGGAIWFCISKRR